MADPRAKKVSRGSEELRAKLTGWGATADLARRLAKRSDLVSRWASGHRIPTPADRALLEDELGIPWRAWDEPVRNDGEAA